MVTYKVGDTIEYTTFGGDVRRVTVTAKHRNVKNGRAGFDAAMNNSDGGGVSVWGYDSDVLRVILPTGEALVPYTTRFSSTPLVHYITRWSGVESDETPLCGSKSYERTTVGITHDSAGMPMHLCVDCVRIANAKMVQAPYQGEPGLEKSKGDSIGQ